jgi:hypothetical protein
MQGGEGMGNDAMSFAVIVSGSGDGLIQAARVQRQLIAAQGCGAQRAGLIKQQQLVLPDGWRDNLDSIAIAENNPRWRRQDRDNNRIRLRCYATKNTTTTTKGADNHNKEDPPRGGNT